MPTRGTTAYLHGSKQGASISIHVPTRGTTRVEDRNNNNQQFQSTCPRGARRPDLHFQSLLYISIHVPTRGTTCRNVSLSAVGRFQSTCPRGARLTSSPIIVIRPISIHVPTRGTTNYILYVIKWFIISIHVPTRGTTSSAEFMGFSQDFNPRAHEGHDFVFIKIIEKHIFQSTCPRGARRTCCKEKRIRYISIHVPTRGTTW